VGGTVNVLLSSLRYLYGCLPETGTVDGGLVSPEERLFERVRTEVR
jgi:hypothetical protein